MLKGFTLIELVVTVAILSIVSLVSVGPLSKFIESNKVGADTQKVISIITTARSKAISSKIQITICGVSNAKKCSRDWLDIQVFNRSDKQNLHQDKLQSNLSSAKWYAFQNKPGLTISSSGFTAHQNGTLYLCHKNHTDLHRAIVVSKSGRVTVDKESPKLQKRCS